MHLTTELSGSELSAAPAQGLGEAGTRVITRWDPVSRQFLHRSPAVEPGGGPHSAALAVEAPAVVACRSNVPQKQHQRAAGDTHTHAAGRKGNAPQPQRAPPPPPHAATAAVVDTPKAGVFPAKKEQAHGRDQEGGVFWDSPVAVHTAAAVDADPGRLVQVFKR